MPTYSYIKVISNYAKMLLYKSGPEWNADRITSLPELVQAMDAVSECTRQLDRRLGAPGWVSGAGVNFVCYQ